uniref:hypothetical protein n=1 Tax=Duncaniella muris TaxID=2094150 RepID=UPI0025A658E9
PAIYYINGTEAELKTIEADGRSEKVEGSWSTQRGDVFVPNSMTDSSNCFSEGAYTNDFITVTVTDHTLKIGVKTTDANSWVIWDNFILRLKEVTEEEVTDAEVAARLWPRAGSTGSEKTSRLHARYSGRHHSPSAIGIPIQFRPALSSFNNINGQTSAFSA